MAHTIFCIRRFVTVVAAWGVWFLLCASAPRAQAQTPPAAQSGAPGATAKSLGTVKNVSGDSVTLTTDSGSDVNVLIPQAATMVRTAPGHKDLQGATPVQLQEVRAGDRMLVRGKLADDGHSIVAASAIVMKKEDIAEKQEREQEDWRQRGMNGVVKAVDPASAVITISTGSLAAKSIAVHVAKDTVLRRYSPDSVKFDDAKPGSLDQIRPGDQLRARGNRSADGSDFTAEEIVSGAFRNIAGTVASTDASNHSLTVTDLLSKKAVTVRVTADSQLRKLPPLMAQMIAARLKGAAPGGGPAAAGPGAQSPTNASAPESNGARPGWNGPGSGGSGSGGQGAGRPGGGSRSGGQGDFQQMLARMPEVALSDLQKGDAVVIVTTAGGATSDPTAITLLTGVEPILSASPNDNRAAMALSPWSFGAPTGDAGP
jgi:Domain of unknown function (DUF5666)